MEKQADLRKWFKEKWVDISRKNPDGSHPECGRDEAKLGKKGYPKCRPKAKAAQMTKKEKSYAVRAKRSKRQGVGGKPTMVPTEKPEKQTKTAMNLYQHFEIGLEKAAKYIKGKPGRANIISRNKHQIASTILTGVPQIAGTLLASDGDIAGGVIGPSMGSHIRDVSNEDRRRGYHHHKKVVDSHMRMLDTKGAQGKSAPAAKLREKLQSATSDAHKEKILDKAMKKTHRHALRSHLLHGEADDFKARFQAFGDNKRIKNRLSKMRTKARETGATAKHFHSVANQAAKSISRQHMAANLVKRKSLQG